MLISSSISTEDFEPDDDAKTKGWPMAVTISANTDRAVGWNMSTVHDESEGEAERRIKWVNAVDVESYDDALTVGCASWWYGKWQDGFRTAGRDL